MWSWTLSLNECSRKTQAKIACLYLLPDCRLLTELERLGKLDSFVIMRPSWAWKGRTTNWKSAKQRGAFVHRGREASEIAEIREHYQVFKRAGLGCTLDLFMTSSSKNSYLTVKRSENYIREQNHCTYTRISLLIRKLLAEQLVTYLED